MNAPFAAAGLVVRAADLADPQERRRLDGFVAAHPDGRIFHRPAWSRAVERGCRQRAHYLLCEDPAGRLRGLLPMSELRSPLFGNSMVSAGFGVGGGILADGDGAASVLADAAWRLARRRGCSEVELRGGPAPGPEWHARAGIYANFAAELAQGDEAILRSIKKRQRAEVRRAFDHGLDHRCGRDAAALDAHYRVYSTSVRNLGTPVFPRALFAAMLDEFGEEADILTLWKDGRPLSTVLSFYYKDTVHPFWGGGTAEARAWRANEALYYALMCRASRRGCTRFDFGRSKLGTGAYAFKKNWGFEPEPLVYAVRTAAGFERSVNPLDTQYQLPVALWKRLPLPVANLIGPLIARGLG
ncbi:MAG TPA: FemAB family XrtA/PEP-CTERM system-associated protein [Allosphingosinicella sp.]